MRYVMPFVGVNWSIGLARPQVAQVRTFDGAADFGARGGRPALAAARQGLHRVCVYGVPFIGVKSAIGFVVPQSVQVRISENAPRVANLALSRVALPPSDH